MLFGLGDRTDGIEGDHPRGTNQLYLASQVVFGPRPDEVGRVTGIMGVLQAGFSIDFLNAITWPKMIGFVLNWNCTYSREVSQTSLNLDMI